MHAGSDKSKVKQFGSTIRVNGKTTNVMGGVSVCLSQLTVTWGPGAATKCKDAVNLTTATIRRVYFMSVSSSRMFTKGSAKWCLETAAPTTDHFQTTKCAAPGRLLTLQMATNSKDKSIRMRNTVKVNTGSRRPMVASCITRATSGTISGRAKAS